MTAPEKNRAVAEACGWDVACDETAHWVDGDDVYIREPGKYESIDEGEWQFFCPLYNANHAHDAAHRFAEARGCTYEVQWGYVSLDGDKREGCYYCVFGCFADGVGTTPAEAISNAILAAGGRG